MAGMSCPKCGFDRQLEGTECPRCGIIFARYRAGKPPALQRQGKPGLGEAAPPRGGISHRMYRVARWVSLAILVSVLVLILRPSPPPRIIIPREAVESAQAKVAEFQNAVHKGRHQTLELNEPELNSWLSSNLALQRSASESPPPPPQAGEEASAQKDPPPVHPQENDAASLLRSTVRDVKIELAGDSLRTFVEFDFHGKTLSFTLEGRLTVQDGYLRLHPTAGKFGSLPLLPATLERVARGLFESPENREKFKLPLSIRDVRIERGSLIVDPR